MLWRLTTNDGPYATGMKVKHRIGGPGTYWVTLLLTDPSGNANTTSRQIKVEYDGDGEDHDGPEHCGGNGDDGGAG